jgi:hypothetical protein
MLLGPMAYMRTATSKNRPIWIRGLRLYMPSKIFGPKWSRFPAPLVVEKLVQPPRTGDGIAAEILCTLVHVRIAVYYPIPFG